jgi:hypothetical protein
MSKLYCFGDSWAAGAELPRYQHSFAHWLARTLDIPYTNYGKEGSSLGLILHTLVTKSSQLFKDDIVIVIVPPDTRWYDENVTQGFYSVQNWQRDDYFKFLNNKTIEWFTYHHALFVYTIQKLLNDVGCYYIMAHNYGQISEYTKYNLPIDYSKFLSEQSLTDILSGHTVEWRSYPKHLAEENWYNQDGPPREIFTGVYFQGCKQHPNELGHQYIANLFEEKYYRDK